MTAGRVEAADPDVPLMLRVQADDPQAFGELYDRFRRRAFTVARAMSHDTPRAEEVVQEAFLAMWRRRESFRPEAGSLSGWLLAIVRNQSIDEARRHGSRERRRAGAERADERPSQDAGPAEAAGARDEAAHLRDALARLPQAQREVIALAYFGELSASEIAARLTLPLGTVKGRMRLGLDKLRSPAPDADA